MRLRLGVARTSIEGREIVVRIPVQVIGLENMLITGESLTPRESQMLEQIQMRKSNKEIASALNLTERTVKRHVSTLMAKAGVRSRHDLL